MYYYTFRNKAFSSHFLFALGMVILFSSCAGNKVTKRDYKKDVLLETNMGNMVLRLSDETPLHRNNFLKLVKTKYYDGVLFHRVINKFMIQSGDPNSRNAPAGKPLGEGEPNYRLAAEFIPSLFHKKGALAAAREGDDANPKKESSASQFYIVQGKVWTEGGLDTLENTRLKGRKIPAEHRAIYTREGGSPHLDQNYTVFGQLISGYDVLDKIAATPTSKGADKDRPLQDVTIQKAKLIKRSK
ncbi:MAG TPA: peptidylprolyl isomerase [Niabella sp.]|nr:peptidylprolyl isomerase [Niabella sp.]HQX19625.1 peptidylprolyl isomerase [Niabella sp.]HRB06934.1 peptidylprolyl isomerase [Niabella sp.]HRB36742.1 peptidylprolyl isomerase [Niabella sp.]HRB43920.1 peptidylprolyl isomerase [Niabella sp.]